MHPLTPNTLARMEDPRSFHARGEAGIHRKRKRETDRPTLPMAPPPPKTGVPVPMKKVVLEEDDYVERLGDIIEVDYFPHNARMVQVLAGEASQSTPFGSTSGTPMSSRASTSGGAMPSVDGLSFRDVESDNNPPSTQRNSGQGGALTKFVATHTSEDNEAFAELQEKDLNARRKKYFWAYESADSADTTKLLLLPTGEIMKAERRALMDKACEARPKIGDERPNQVVETWKHRTRNQLMFSPNMATSNDICRTDLEADNPTAPPLLEGGVAVQALASASDRQEGSGPSPLLIPTARGKLIVEPLLGMGQGSDGKHNTSSSPHNAKMKTQVQVVARRSVIPLTNPKVIQAKATRFPLPKTHPHGKVGASPIEKPSSSRDSVVELMAEGGKGSKEFEEVPMTPTPMPGMGGDSPLITWGSIDGTPMILDPRATPLPDGTLLGSMASFMTTNGEKGVRGIEVGPHFELKDLPRRDKLAHSLEAADTRRRRSKGQQGAPPGLQHTPVVARKGTPRTPGLPGTLLSSRRGGKKIEGPSPSPLPLTPAARTLAGKLAQRSQGDIPFGGGLTPGRQKKRHGGVRSVGQVREEDGQTPLASPLVGRSETTSIRGRKSDGNKGKGASLTDGLLAV
ncbi:unnamed protein product [Choristocarpus tenellus]